jgi:CRISPR/Cas system CMR subunit Cmr4 (Cas7 group RAMP superfamily)
LGGERVEIKSQDAKVRYRVTLEPENFFHFGAGFGDDEVDDTFVTERIVVWENGEGSLSREHILIPASSLKGALSHRTAFHYNRLIERFADDPALFDAFGENNEAVAALFGAAKGHKNEAKGKLLFSDLFKPHRILETKIFDHVKIDRFTGGAVSGVLFNEKVSAQKEAWELEIVVTETVADPIYVEAFEAALEDLTQGRLPLGGKVNRGHGVFTGTWSKEEQNVEK